MNRAAGLAVSLLLLLWTVPAHAGHIMGLTSYSVTPDTVKVGEKVKITLKGYINNKNYECLLTASTSDGAIATTPAKIASPSDASISLASPFNFDVSFDATFAKPYAPGEITVKLGQSTLEGQASGNCDSGSPAVTQVWVMAAAGKGKLTGVSFGAPKVKVGEPVGYTVAGTGGLCNLTFQFVGGGWNGDTSGVKTAFPFTAAQAAFTTAGNAELTVASQGSPTCDAGEVKAVMLVEKAEVAPAKKPDLVCTVAAYKDAARTDKIKGGDTVNVGPASKVYFVVTLQNVGAGDVVQKSFESRVQYKLNNQVVGHPGFSITGPVPVGQTPRTVTVREMAVPAGTTTMEVTGSVDSKNQVGDEADKANNECKLTITTKLLQRQQQPASSSQQRGGAADAPAMVTPRR